jgi:dsDNA-specific endonuclease/ATPase MutS2
MSEPGGERDDDLEGEAAVVRLPIEDVLDLHGFRPAEIRDLVRSYLDEAHAAGLRRVRLIHGKGIGVQREAVRAILAADPRVRGFGDLPAGQGGWGATWAELAD